MSIPTFNVFDGDGGGNVPRRPSIGDLGGAAFQNYVIPPDETTMPSAQMENQNELVLQGLAKLSPTAVIYVTFPAGVPTKTTVIGCGSLLSATDFTLTDNGAGDTTVVVAANKLPTLQPFHMVFPIPSGTGDWTASARSVALGWRVETRSAGVLTDCPFALFFL